MSAFTELTTPEVPPEVRLVMLNDDCPDYAAGCCCPFCIARDRERNARSEAA